MISRHERRLFIVGIVYLLISVPVFLLTNRFVHAYYAVNVFLAFLPYVIAKYLANQKPKKPWNIGVALAVWLLFFPNAFYLWTDFIHLSGLTFYTQANPYAPLVYAQNLVDWIALIHTLFGALLGTVFGARSFWLVWYAVVKHWRKPYQAMVYLGVPLLSAIGIYIGRFLRFNSWDVLRPWLIVREFTASINGFALGFIALFFIGQLAVLWMAESFKESDIVRS
jgi:uncharacterized membrane protein